MFGVFGQVEDETIQDSSLLSLFLLFFQNFPVVTSSSSSRVSVAFLSCCFSDYLSSLPSLLFQMDGCALAGLWLWHNLFYIFWMMACKTALDIVLWSYLHFALLHNSTCLACSLVFMTLFSLHCSPTSLKMKAAVFTCIKLHSISKLSSLGSSSHWIVHSCTGENRNKLICTPQHKLLVLGISKQNTVKLMVSWWQNVETLKLYEYFCKAQYVYDLCLCYFPSIFDAVC